MPVTVAIDFETADYQTDSACAVGLARVEDGAVTATWSTLIRPPRRRVFFTDIHGLTWAKLKDSAPFADIWPTMAEFMQGASRLVAHNAPFDRRVLLGCCAANNLAPPELPFDCTLKLARRRLRLPSHRLDAVCTHLNIPLNHHDAASDALAAAMIWVLLEGGKN